MTFTTITIHYSIKAHQEPQEQQHRTLASILRNFHNRDRQGRRLGHSRGREKVTSPLQLSTTSEPEATDKQAGDSAVSSMDKDIGAPVLPQRRTQPESPSKDDDDDVVSDSDDEKMNNGPQQDNDEETGKDIAHRKETSRHDDSNTKIYEIGSFCPGCVGSPISWTLDRGRRIHRYIERSNMTEIEAAKVVFQEFPEQCRACDPTTCHRQQDRTFWRMDAVAPRILAAHSHYLTSITDKHRVPREALSDLDTYFSKKENVHPARMHLFEYNPSIVQIPADQIPQIEGEDAPAVYLATFRVSNMQQCIAGEDEVIMLTGDHELAKSGGDWSRPKTHDYAGFALLRADLSLIQDVVVDFKRAKAFTWGDFRVHVLDGSLYVSSGDDSYPIWLVKPMDMTDVVELQQTFPSSMTIYSRGYASCSDAGRRNKNKNLNYFIDTETRQTVVEMSPMTDRLQVDMVGKCILSTKNLTRYRLDDIPDPSFATLDELHFTKQQVFTPPVVTGERGSSCCIPFQGPDGKELLLGISHSKTRFRTKDNRDNLRGNVAANQFFSSFYVMEPTAPYKVVARTGRFCFGFPSKDETESNPYALNNMQPIVIGNTYNCPRIHFVSGMVEKFGDPTRVIIAMGINDCSPRMVEVSKADISRMLFPGDEPDLAVSSY